MVYRNVVLKRATAMFSRDDAYSKIGEFVELERVNGRKFFVSRMSVIAFCEHGDELPADYISLE